MSSYLFALQRFAPLPWLFSQALAALPWSFSQASSMLGKTGGTARQGRCRWCNNAYMGDTAWPGGPRRLASSSRHCKAESPRQAEAVVVSAIAHFGGIRPLPKHGRKPQGRPARQRAAQEV